MFGPNTRVLVIDDMKTMRKVVIKSCTDIGFKNFKEAADGNEAWQLLQAETFDLVISDWNMPNCTGLELLTKVRADAKLKGLPFVLLTAETEISQVKEAITRGADNYIVKPFSTEILRERLTQVAKKRNINAA